MNITDIRLLNKKEKMEIANNFSAEFAYVLSKKINQPVYCSKRVKSLKFFVEYFNVMESEYDFNLVDLNRVVTPKNIKSYEMVDIDQNSLNAEMVCFLESQMQNSFNVLLKKEINGLTYTYYENEIYQADIPFRRDVMVVRDKDLVVATCYVTGYLFDKSDIRLINKDCLNRIIITNSDCKKMISKFDCKYELLEDYLSDRYSKNFIDSVLVRKEYRSKGICTTIYEIIFRHFNSKEINITSCKNDIQSDDAIRLWRKLRDIYADNYGVYNDFYFLDFRDKKNQL